MTLLSVGIQQIEPLQNEECPPNFYIKRTFFIEFLKRPNASSTFFQIHVQNRYLRQILFAQFVVHR
jgi:hypothetical protein